MSLHYRGWPGVEGKFPSRSAVAMAAAGKLERDALFKKLRAKPENKVSRTPATSRTLSAPACGRRGVAFLAAHVCGRVKGVQCFCWVEPEYG